MNLPSFARTLLYTALISVPGCGGGGGSSDGVAAVSPAPSPTGGSGGGIGGSGVSSSGTIDAFGSIFVNGVEFETGEAEVILDGESVGESALGLGMVVLVKGTINDDGITGTATRVIFDNEVQGPVTDIQLIDDGSSKILTVLGVTVIVEQTGTVFEDVTFDTLASGDLLEDSGHVVRDRMLEALKLLGRAESET